MSFVRGKYIYNKPIRFRLDNGVIAIYICVYVIFTANLEMVGKRNLMDIIPHIQYIFVQDCFKNIYNESYIPDKIIKKLKLKIIQSIVKSFNKNSLCLVVEETLRDKCLEFESDENYMED